jgi:hypothetical protein
MAECVLGTPTEGIHPDRAEPLDSATRAGRQTERDRRVLRRVSIRQRGLPPEAPEGGEGRVSLLHGEAIISASCILFDGSPSQRGFPSRR